MRVRKLFGRSPLSSGLPKSNDLKSGEKFLFCPIQLRLISDRLSLLFNAAVHLSTSHIGSESGREKEMVAIKSIKNLFTLDDRIEKLIEKAENLMAAITQDSSKELASEITALHQKTLPLSKKLDKTNKDTLNSALSNLKEALKFSYEPENPDNDTVAENEQKVDSNERVRKAMVSELQALDKAIPYPVEFNSLHKEVVDFQIDKVNKIDLQNTKSVEECVEKVSKLKEAVYNNVFTIFSQRLANADSPQTLNDEMEAMQKNIQTKSYPTQLQLYTFTVRLFNLPQSKVAVSPASGNKILHPTNA